MKPYSIARRLITTVLLVELVAALCVTAAAWVYERHTHFRTFDIMLRGRADSLLGAVQDAEDTQDNVMLDGSESALPADDIYEVEDASGRVLGHSARWASLTSPSSHHPLSINQLTFDRNNIARVHVDGESFRLLRLQGLRIVDPGDKGGGIRRYVTIYYGSSIERASRAVFRSVTFYSLTSLLVLAITGLLMSWLLNRGLAPLRELASGASKVSVRSWTFNPPAEARNTKELAPLVIALENVLQGLEQAFDQQKRFVGDAAHELKTSVAVVKSSLQLIGMKPRTAQEYEAGLQRCLIDCERMEAIVAQMLTLARIEDENPAQFADATADISQATQDVIEQLRTMAGVSNIAIEVHCRQPIFARVDSEQFKLLCTNLLMNAIQHSPAGSAITIETAAIHNLCELRVADHGEGIDPNDIQHLFERFFRSDPSRSRSTGGTGLGLAICKAIADKFHGSIDILSEPGTGTTVVVRFPLAYAIDEVQIAL